MSETKPIEVRPNRGFVIDADGVCPNVDEVVGKGHLHVEQMSKTTYWARLYAFNGPDVVMWFNVVDGELVLSTEFDV